jgi:hypothetical protein
MNVTRANQTVFWICYVLGTVGPVLGTFLLEHFRRPFDDSAFLLSWLLWFLAAIVLVISAWSVRNFLWGPVNTPQRTGLLYRIFGWLAIMEAIVWIWTCVSSI